MNEISTNNPHLARETKIYIYFLEVELYFLWIMQMFWQWPLTYIKDIEPKNIYSLKRHDFFFPLTHRSQYLIVYFARYEHLCLSAT